MHDGATKEKLYDLFLQFFSYQKKKNSDDVATHTYTFKNLGNDPKLEI